MEGLGKYTISGSVDIFLINTGVCVCVWGDIITEIKTTCWN